MENNVVIKSAMMTYDKMATFRADIILSNTLPGSGDYEDPIDVRENQFIKCHYIKYTMVETKRTQLGGWHVNLEDAIQEIQKSDCFIRWIDPDDVISAQQGDAPEPATMIFPARQHHIGRPGDL